MLRRVGLCFVGRVFLCDSMRGVVGHTLCQFRFIFYAFVACLNKKNSYREIRTNRAHRLSFTPADSAENPRVAGPGSCGFKRYV